MGGAWLPDDIIDTELALAEELGKRWNKLTFTSEPPFTQVCGHLVQLESYHHSDGANLLINVNVNSSNVKAPLNFIRLDNPSTQALLRWDLLGAKIYSQECTPMNECGRVDTKSIMVRRVLLERCALYAYHTEAQSMKYLKKTLIAFKMSRYHYLRFFILIIKSL